MSVAVLRSSSRLSPSSLVSASELSAAGDLELAVGAAEMGRRGPGGYATGYARDPGGRATWLLAARCLAGRRYTLALTSRRGRRPVTIGQ